MPRLTLIFVAVLTVLLCTTVAAAAAASHTVNLANNLTIHGRASPLSPTVHEFLGIPYAAPPLGPLRWQPPQPYHHPTGSSVAINATALPPSCWQYISSHPGILRTDAPEFMIGDAGMSEDCLTMSVWAPARAQEDDGMGPLPVLIWFYGGGFATGGIDVPYQIPTRWIERSQEHIVVVFNYRLNIFGFPTAAGLGPTAQNFGLLDQRFAVEWIRDNIGAFGGDASRMVIWGQSAGATAVDFYQYAYPEDPIVTGLIQDSGTAHLDILKNSNVGDYSSFSLVATNVGCTNATSAAAELDCMRGVPAEELEAFVAAYEDGGDDPALTFIPVVDGVLVFENYTERAAAGNMSTLPAIIGNVANEGMFLTAYNTTDPEFATALEYSYEYFWCPTAVTTLERLANNRTTHRWFYSGNFTNISPKYWDGAYHESELPLLFGTHMDFRGNSTSFEYELSHAMQDAYVAFITDPEHGLDRTIGWPAYKGLGGDVIEWGRGGMSNMTVAQLTTLASIEEGCRTRGLL